MPSPSQPLTVIKLGGAVLDDPATVDLVWSQIGALRAGGPVLVVHGGGQQATALAGRLGHTPRILHGRRVTTDVDLDIALWAFRGALNTALVAAASRRDVPAAGLSGVDGATLVVHRRPPREVDGEMVDFGWVGDVDHVNPALLQVLVEGGVVPVVAPLGVDAEGRIYNVNADTVAVAIAEAVGASTLLMVATSGGLRRDADDPASHCLECDPGVVASGVADGWITAGMRVKLETALAAARAVPNVYIVPPDALATPHRGTWVRAKASTAP